MDARTVIITGASSGIGLGLAEAFLNRGYNVVANARTKERLQQAADILGNPNTLLTIEGDIALKTTAEKIISKAVDRFGGIDILVNNAGIFLVKPFSEITGEEVDQLINTNLKGFFYVSQLAANVMAKQGQGHIINITASMAMNPNMQVPAAIPFLIKAGLNAATRALSLELASKNIKVNAVAPGIIDTPLYTPEMHPFLDTLQPTGKIGKIKDVVDAVLYLTEAAFTTGTILPVDGGLAAGKW